MAGSGPQPDLGALKLRQQATWASGDYAIIGATLQIVGETLCEAMDLRSGWRVLDVAAGNGNATLAAARRGCEVTSTDYVPALLDRGRARAEVEGFTIRFEPADAENLPFPDAEFDAVMSTFGAMFTPNQERTAAEMLRVCKPGGRIGMANWTPAGFVGQIFRCIGRYAPPPAGIRSPAAWGTEARLDELFGKEATVHAASRNFVFRYRSAAHFLDVFRSYYGPMHKAFASLDETGQAGLAADLRDLMAQLNRASDGTLVIPGEYLEIVIVKHAAG